MTTRRTAAGGGLSTSDIDGIRSTLAAGRKPKVMFTASAGQIAGEVGQVVKLADPAESDEWLTVRFGRDELPFSPADLTIPPRGRATKRPDPKPVSPPASPPASQSAPASVPAPRPAAKPAAPDAKPPAPAAKSAAPAAKPDAPAAGDSARPRPAKRATKARSARPKAPASLTVTLAYETGEWTVAAHQGSKTLAKPYVVRPADALKMVAMLDVSGVHDAVEAIVTAELTEAAQRAETLRSELAEVEARLAELRDVS